MSKTLKDQYLESKSPDDQNLRFFPDNPTETDHKRAFVAKEASAYYDPCAKAAKMSQRCMERHNYDRDQCTEYFRAYRECKKSWLDERKKDRLEGNKW